MEDLTLIHCIGDSHACFFGGYDEIQLGYPYESRNKYPFFKSYRLGSVLAFSLNKLNTKEKGRENLLELVDKLEKNSSLLLCFGEIDCRCHLLKQAEIQKKPLHKCVESCVLAYFSVVDELMTKGFKLMIWNVIPSAYSDNKEYPTYGTLEARNECTKIFNNYLERECLIRNIDFISIYKKLLDSKGRTKFIYYFDSIHLGQLAMPFALIEVYKKNKKDLSPYISYIDIQFLFVKSFFSRAIFRLKKFLFPIIKRSFVWLGIYKRNTKTTEC